ncbi:hypothetical protein ABE871_07300 [Enterococcus gilvus]|uniref:hypothetical protein n=1 Tax=Enterococcus gilvus TaxID=160453 RepID=UPI003D6A9205
MKKICFVLNFCSGLNYASMFAGPTYKNNDSLKNYFSNYYDVSTNYLRDEDLVDYLIVPKPLPSFYNKNHLPIIEVPANFFWKKDFEKIKIYIDNFLANNCS